jgi:hypothetical protein
MLSRASAKGTALRKAPEIWQAGSELPEVQLTELRANPKEGELEKEAARAAPALM